MGYVLPDLLSLRLAQFLQAAGGYHFSSYTWLFPSSVFPEQAGEVGISISVLPVR